MRSRGTTVLILGIGNLLWADEGFGVRAVEELHRAYEFDDDVRVMDGGTQGIYLVQHVRAVGAGRALLTVLSVLARNIV